MRIQGAILAATIAAMPVVVQAQPIQGLYVGGGAGGSFAQDTTLTTGGSAFSSGRATASRDAGFVALGNLGYALGNGIRFEIEANYGQNALSQLAVPGIQTSASGTVRHYGVMANALFDMDVGSPWVYPYIGGGVGYQWTNLNNVGVSQNGGGFAYRVNATQGAAAAQVIAGASFPIPNVPGLSVTPEYRFMDILGGDRFTGTTGTGASAQVKLHNQFDHNLVLGVRYAFNVPPPPAPASAAAAVPAAEPTRSYLVFFDWDKALLTEKARGIVKDAAANAGRVQHTRIDVAGNADTSGTPAYNQGLSMRRAQAVAAELVKDGVAKTAITITAAGDSKPLVPTGPGVREPQNRRVEIVLR